MEFTHFVGVDIAKEKFDAEFTNCTGVICRSELSNDIKGASKLIRLLEKSGNSRTTTLICMEHTGHYIDRLARILSGEGYFVWVVSPLFLKSFGPKPLGLQNDRVSASKLREYAGYFFELAQRYVPDSPFEDELKKLFRLRKQLIRCKTRFSNMKSSNQDLATPHPLTDRIWEEMVQRFDRLIKTVDTLLMEQLLSCPKYKRMYEILLSVPAIGPVCAKQLLILTKGFSRFTNFRAFASFIATAPYEKSSGKRSRRPKTSKSGHKSMKSNLFMGVLRNIRPGGFFAIRYRFETEVRKKHHLSVMNALINRLLKIVFDMIRLNQKFDIGLYQQAKNKPELTLS